MGVQEFGFGVQDFVCEAQDFGFRVQDFDFGFPDFGFRIQACGLGVQFLVFGPIMALDRNPKIKRDTDSCS